MSIFTGSCVALVTPFKGQEINYDAFAELIEFQIREKTDAILVCGTTGEPATMPDDEHIAAIQFVVKTVNKRVPVLAGTGANDTPHAVKLSEHAHKAGADGLLVVTPYYNKATPKGLVKHFEEITSATDLPIILYNVPSRTGMSIGVSTLDKLADIPTIVGIKEASGDIGLLAKMAATCGDRLDFYSGNDDMILPALSLGAKGVISVLANVAPFNTREMVAQFTAGNVDKAIRLQLDAMPLIEALFCEVNPIPVKTALRLMGYDTGNLRLPLCDMDEANFQKLEKAMRSYGLI